MFYRKIKLYNTFINKKYYIFLFICIFCLCLFLGVFQWDIKAEEAINNDIITIYFVTNDINKFHTNLLEILNFNKTLITSRQATNDISRYMYIWDTFELVSTFKNKDNKCIEYYLLKITIIPNNPKIYNNHPLISFIVTNLEHVGHCKVFRLEKFYKKSQFWNLILDRNTKILFVDFENNNIFLEYIKQHKNEFVDWINELIIEDLNKKNELINSNLKKSEYLKKILDKLKDK